jgi:coiled-coil domain-containing protein 130
VRFNAEKRATGERYLTTPIWAFTLRHPACGGAIEIRTDPKNAEYVVVSGARRRDYGGGAAKTEEDESLVNLGPGAPASQTIATARERAEQRASAFGALEKTIADREQAARAGQRLGELRDAADRQWDDPYAQNRRLRAAFRVGRRAREREAAAADEIRERMGLGIELLPEAAEDAQRARLVDFGGGVDAARDDGGVDRALARPLFAGEGAAGGKRRKKEEEGRAAVKGQRKLKAEVAASRTRENLVSEIVSNTRAARDPFLDFGSRESTPKRPVRLPGIKRKRSKEEAADTPSLAAAEGSTTTVAACSTALVSYESDSD